MYKCLKRIARIIFSANMTINSYITYIDVC